MIKKDYTKRNRKKIRIRKKVNGTTERPRLTVFRSLKQIYAQIIDDSNGKTLLAASSATKELADKVKAAKSKVEVGSIVGEFLGGKAVEAGIKEVVFDRAGFMYHGRVKALADGARKGGLKI